MNGFLEIALEKCVLSDDHLTLYNTKTKEEIVYDHEDFEEKEHVRYLYNNLTIHVTNLLTFNKVIVNFTKVLETYMKKQNKTTKDWAIFEAVLYLLNDVINEGAEEKNYN